MLFKTRLFLRRLTRTARCSARKNKKMIYASFIQHLPDFQLEPQMLSTFYL